MEAAGKFGGLSHSSAAALLSQTSTALYVCNPAQSSTCECQVHASQDRVDVHACEVVEQIDLSCQLPGQDLT